MRVEYFSEIGRDHASNEDSSWGQSGLGFFAVADGIGGSATGAASSRVAVDICAEILRRDPFLAGEPKTWIRRTLEEANRAVFRLAQGKASSHGSTAVLLGLSQDTAWFGWVGDSRLYRLRGKKLEQLTRDHSRFQELVARGVINEAKVDPALKKGALTRCLGLRDEVVVEEGSTDVKGGDRFLLVTDGVSDAVEADTFASLAALDDPKEALGSIARAVADGGNRDDATCVLVIVDDEDLARAPSPDPDEVIRCLTSLMPSPRRDAVVPANRRSLTMAGFFKGLVRSPSRKIALEGALLASFLGVGLFLPDIIQLFGRKLEAVAGLYSCIAGLVLYLLVLRLRLR